MDVFEVCVKFCSCDFNNKRIIVIQKIKVRKLVLNFLFLHIKLHQPTSPHAEQFALSFVILHDVVTLVVFEIFHKLNPTATTVVYP